MGCFGHSVSARDISLARRPLNTFCDNFTVFRSRTPRLTELKSAETSWTKKKPQVPCRVCGFGIEISFPCSVRPAPRPSLRNRPRSRNRFSRFRKKIEDENEEEDEENASLTDLNRAGPRDIAQQIVRGRVPKSPRDHDSGKTLGLRTICERSRGGRSDRKSVV